MKRNNKAFTLIELLVVVLIIGILAAIAVPQYQVAVEKSRFSTLKEKTRALAQAINMYLLATGEHPTKLSDLDISFSDIKGSSYLGSGEMSLSFNDGTTCYVWNPHTWPMVACYLKDDKMRFYYDPISLKPFQCYSTSTNAAGIKVCAQETGNTDYSTNASYSVYLY